MCWNRVGTKICWAVALQEFDTPAFKPIRLSFISETQIMFLLKLRHFCLSIKSLFMTFQTTWIKKLYLYGIYFLIFFYFFYLIMTVLKHQRFGWSDFQWRDRQFPGFNKNVFVFQKWKKILWVWSNMRVRNDKVLISWLLIFIFFISIIFLLLHKFVNVKSAVGIVSPCFKLNR